MADNVNITAGTGTVIATDQVGTDHYQRIKLTDGTADSSTPVNVDIGAKANALRVAPANDITAGTYIGGVGGDVAHDSGDSGNPVKVGGKAHNLDGTAPGTAVAENDRAHFITDVYGRQFVETCHPNLWSASDNQSTAQTNTALKAAPGAGLSLYITDVIVSNGATAGNIKFVEDTAGTPVDKIEVMYFAANGGAVIPFKTPIKITANKDFGYTSVDVTTHSITISGFIAP